MVTLELASSLSRCETLPHTLDIEALRDVHIYGESERDAMRSVAADAARCGRHDIVEAIEDCLRRCADTPDGRSGSPLSVSSSPVIR